MKKYQEFKFIDDEDSPTIIKTTAKPKEVEILIKYMRENREELAKKDKYNYENLLNLLQSKGHTAEIINFQEIKGL